MIAMTTPIPTDLIDCAVLREQVENLSEALAQWADRDDSKAQPQVRQAADVAMIAIDAALRELHAIRSRLVDEIHHSDAAAMRRSGELLDRIRAEREATTSHS